MRVVTDTASAALVDHFTDQNLVYRSFEVLLTLAANAAPEAMVRGTQ